jgi:hypothetical protein
VEDPGLVLGECLFPVWVIDQVFPDPTSRKCTVISEAEDTHENHQPHSETLFPAIYCLV